MAISGFRRELRAVGRGVALACLAALVPLLGVSPARAQSSPNVYQSGWAGYILYVPNYKPAVIPRHRFQAIEAEWVVPSASPTINCDFKPEQTDGSSLWIGLDGWAETMRRPPYTDVLQAGTETDVPCWNGKARPAKAYFWIEWDGTRNIMTLRLNVGDLIHLRIAATTTGPHAWQQATVTLDDLTTGLSDMKTFHSGCIRCGKPSQEPATLVGNTAEWVVETTFYDADNPKWPNTLNDFGTAQFNNIAVTDIKGVTYTPASLGGATPELDWMTVNGQSLADGDTLLACAAVTGPQAITLTRAPFQIVTPGQQGDLEPKPQNCSGGSGGTAAAP